LFKEEKIHAILFCVPVGEGNLLEKTVNSFRVGQEAVVEFSCIPAEEHIPKVKNNGGNGVCHIRGLLYPKKSKLAV